MMNFLVGLILGALVGLYIGNQSIQKNAKELGTVTYTTVKNGVKEVRRADTTKAP